MPSKTFIGKWSEKKKQKKALKEGTKEAELQRDALLLELTKLTNEGQVMLRSMSAGEELDRARFTLQGFITRQNVVGQKVVDPQAQVTQLTELKREVQSWRSETIKAMTTRNTVVSKEQLTTRVDEAKVLASQLGGLTEPPMLRSAIDEGERVLGSKTPDETDLAEAMKKVDAVLATKNQLRAFVQARVGLEQREQSADLALRLNAHPLMAGVARIRTGAIGFADTAWSQLTAPGDAANPLQKLNQGLTASARLRTENHQALVDAEQQIATIAERAERLSASKVYGLNLANSALGNARQLFTQVNDATTLKAALAELKRASDLLDEAESMVNPAQREALDKFAQKRRELLDQIDKASRLRGAPTDPEMLRLIGEAETALSNADKALQNAMTSEHVAKATELLSLQIGKNVVGPAEKRSALLKAQAEKDLKAVGAYQLAFAEIQLLRNEIAQLPGTTVTLQTIDGLMATTRLGSDGQPPNGFAAALTALTTPAPATYRQQATEESKRFTTITLTGAAKTALDEAEVALQAFADCHPEQLVGAQRERLVKAAQGPTPEVALADLKAEWLKKVNDQNQLQSDLVKKQGQLDVLLKSLATLVADTDPSLLSLQQQAGRADGMLTTWNLVPAGPLLDGLIVTATDYDTSQKKHKQDLDGMQQALTDLGLLAARFSDAWPPLSAVAKSAKLAVDELPKLLASGAFTLAEAVASATGLTTNTRRQLDELIQKANLAPDTDLAPYAKAADQIGKAWALEMQKARESLARLGEALKKQGVASGEASTTLPGELAAVNQRWEAGTRKFVVKPGEDPKTVLMALFKTLVGELRLVVAKADAALDPTGKTALDGFVDEGKKQETLNGWRAQYDTALRLIGELGLLNTDVSGFRRQLGVFDPTTADAEQAKAWGLLGETVKAALEKERLALKQRKLSAAPRASTLNTELSKLFDPDRSDFAGLFTDLRQRCGDAVAMLESDDPALISAAEKELAALEKVVNGMRGKSKDGAVTLDDIKALFDKLSHLLGDGGIVKSRLPDTHLRLKAQLDGAILIAKKSEPAKGREALLVLVAPFEKARDAAEAMVLRYEAFKLRSEQMDKLRDKALKHAETTLLGGRIAAYNERFDARLGEAKLLAKQEGAMDKAFAALDVIEKELNGLLAQTPDAARESLQSMNDQAEQEQRELRDLARIWNNTIDAWKDTLLPAVKKAMEDRDADDFTEYDGLKASVKNASASLQGYLDVISAIPHKKLGANGAPDIKTVRAAFAQGHLRLGNLNKLALRLQTNADTTNVELQKDLDKLEQEWATRAGAVNTAFERLAGSLGGLPAQVSDQADLNGKPNPDYLDVGGKQALSTSVGLLQKVLPELSKRFPAGAFSGPLGVLRTATDAPARLKAREEALRTMRALKADLVDNKLMQGLFEGAAKGVLDVDVRQPVGLLRASLKKIELAVLVGV